MTTVSDETIAPMVLRADPDSRPTLAPSPEAKPQGRPRLLWRAVLWCLVAAIAAGTAGFFVGLILGAVGAKDWLTADQRTALYYIAGLSGAGVILLYAAHRNALVLGGGDLRAGLGAGPVQRLWLVIVLSVVAAMYGSFISYAVSLQPGAMNTAAAAGWILNIILAALAILLAPLAEEWFFRGWLWTALTQRWPTLPVAVVTSAFWLTLHLPDGAGRTVALLPVAICIVVARRYSDTVTASLAVHVVYNIFSVSTPLLILAMR